MIFHLDHNIEIRRCTEFRKYVFNGKERKYYPDFIVNGQYFEIKGYNSPQWEAKHAANPDVKVLFERDMLEIFQYVEIKYGVNYTDLYENKL